MNVIHYIYRTDYQWVINLDIVIQPNGSMENFEIGQSSWDRWRGLSNFQEEIFNVRLKTRTIFHIFKDKEAKDISWLEE